jgi:hypothetical protein
MLESSARSGILVLGSNGETIFGSWEEEIQTTLA